ncbi:hypothetical protein CCR94_21540 [Rhodoblastus sphagnicola]|uniref:DUF2460 domain-containing protein n=1 Tax=Rhodoblastus sphagnicola TaxID=333368 RepID=A0A2S6MWX2_9HYPH|nr:DUF2460 domain-containing protein [Rhodoblastus sphagnicola]MBB4200686.1 uncharacterized protein (TIGR02217 family) [Rhodoblastus sphagnicola]PPQ26849.1 hypothetical protein CCR94_21540 [Rhodoblastus sphagnicola]
MTLATFPTLPGQGWSVKKTPTFSTRVASHASGREVRVPLYARALYQFELSFDALDSSGANPALQSQSLQTLMGFWMSCNGQLNTFLYVDPTDNAATSQTIATGDGATTRFVLGRAIGGYYEPVSYVISIANVTVGGASTTAYTFTAPNTIAFATPPASGATIAATFSYGFQCRFLDDVAEFENFLSGLWKIGGLKFRQVR